MKPRNKYIAILLIGLTIIAASFPWCDTLWGIGVGVAGASIAGWMMGKISMYDYWNFWP